MKLYNLCLLIGNIWMAFSLTFNNPFSMAVGTLWIGLGAFGYWKHSKVRA